MSRSLESLPSAVMRKHVLSEHRGYRQNLAVGGHDACHDASAENAGEPEIIIVAALLHDIGHFTSEFGSFTMEDVEDRHHEEAGAAVLERFFPTLVTDCVRYHVAAKRYLCAARPEYFKRLSEASVLSLKLQGGPMSSVEVAEFEKNPNVKEIVKVRHYDDAGKRTDMKTQPFSYYAPMVQRVVDAHCRKAAE